MMERLRQRIRDGYMAPHWPHWPQWLLWQTPTALVALYIATKVALRLAHARRWYAFGRFDLALLLTLAVAIGVVSWLVYRRARRDIAAAQRRQQQAEALAAENAAVARVARAVAREFAQPLSGALCYSEMLMPQVDRLDEEMRYEMTGLREGVLRLERLLLTLRAVVEDTPTSASHGRLADTVEQTMAPRSRAPSGAAPRA